MMFYRHSILQFKILAQICYVPQKVQAKYSFEKTSPSDGKMQLFPKPQLAIWFAVISGILL